MNILFLFQRFSFESSTIYKDLVEECVAAGHGVYVLAGTTAGGKTGASSGGRSEGAAGTADERSGRSLADVNGAKVAYVPLPDQFGAGRIKKGLVQLLIRPIFIRTLKRLLWDAKIDLIAYPTPPITLAGVVSAAKSHFRCRTCLMLKDIFPQNAVDLGMMKEGSLIHSYFRAMERRLYEVSDVIGCMSAANISYVSKHNPEVKDRLELFPNTVKIRKEQAEIEPSEAERGPVRFVVGGNLGEPQAVELLLEGIKRLSEEGFDGAHFLIIGDGTRAKQVEEAAASLKNLTFHRQLPREEYERLLAHQEVGIISLSHRFTIPNFPSRLLSYMQLSKPVLVVSDLNTDIGTVVRDEAKCGFFVPSDDVSKFTRQIKDICERRDELATLGENGRRFLEENYDVKGSVRLLEAAAGK